jgi:stage V sporulation protein SpoVS
MSKKKSTLAKQEELSESELFAEASLSASFMGASLADSFNSAILPKAELCDVASALSDQIKTIQDGDMQPIEAMLISQAHALQTMFVTLGRMAASKTQLAQYTAFMNMALKAQSQSRATIQALTELKYPKQATFVKQANIAHGHQQVNNGNECKASSRTKENQNQSNELLEAHHGNKKVDRRTTRSAVAKNKAMATVAT